MALPLAPSLLDHYVSVMADFVAGRIDGETFEQRYYAVFKHDETDLPDEVAAALDDVFWAADSFYADPTLRDEGDLDADQLRERVRAALATLQQILAPA